MEGGKKKEATPSSANAEGNEKMDVSWLHS